MPPESHRHAYPMTSIANALEIVISHCTPLGTEVLDLDDCLGRVLAKDLQATIDVPNTDVSMMDGYGMIAATTADASDTTPHLVDVANYVATGRQLPGGTDCVVPIEAVRSLDTTLVISEPVARGAYVRNAGSTIANGSVAIPKNTGLSAIALAVAATVGNSSLEVRRTPRVAVMSTGDELCPPGIPLATGQTYDSNRVLITQTAKAFGATVCSTSHIPDEMSALQSALKQASQDSDVVITSGGASVGNKDLLVDALEATGSMQVSRVALKPGMPFRFGLVNNTPVFVLPGNPASVAACFHTFVAPALRYLSGRPVAAAGGSGVLTADVEAPSNRTFMCPAVAIDGRVTPALLAPSASIHNHLDTNAYAVIPAGGATAGTSVTIEWIK